MTEKIANIEKPYVSKAIDYYKDIEPYGFIQINAGVGSGKSTFINELVNGYTAKSEDGMEDTVPPQRVLLITSRRAKVDEILNDKNVSMGAHVMEWENNCPVDNIDEYLDNIIDIPDLDGSGERKIHQRSIACTNAAVEKYLQYHYIPNDASTHLWQRFDFIVWDEVHSVLADASYQSAPFYVHKLVNKTYKAFREKESTCRVILMTGSPRILENFKLPKQGNKLDLMDKCKSVVPRSLSFVDTVEAKKGILRRLENGERVIYFANHIKTIFEMYSELGAELQSTTAFSFKQKERLDVSDPAQEKLCKRMENTEKAIAENQMLPENIKLLLTTSKNKEGINIWNEDIKALYVESHAEVDIVQMAGRVRNGVDCLYIVTDAGGFGRTENKWEYRFSLNRTPIDAIEISEEAGNNIKKLNLVEYINDYYAELCRKHGIDLKEEWRQHTYGHEAAATFIDFIHGKFPYIKYDYFTDMFALYSDRKSSIEYFDEQAKRYKSAADDKERLTTLAKSWFEGIPVIWPEDSQAQIDTYLIENNLIGMPYDSEKREQIKVAIGKILGKTIKQLNSTLNKFGYKEDDCSKNMDASTYGKKKITKL